MCGRVTNKPTLNEKVKKMAGKPAAKKLWEIYFPSLSSYLPLHSTPHHSIIMSSRPEGKNSTEAAADLLDSEYDSADDSDFDPSAPTTTADNGEDDFSSSSDSENDALNTSTAIPKKKRKRATSVSSIPSDDDDEQGATISIIKTRAQRRLESPGRKTSGVTPGTATTDVDALWAAMNSPAVPTPPQQVELKPSPPPVAESATGEKMVEIKHTYEFAGKTITESRMVPASSESARVHLSSASASPAPAPAPTPPTGRRPPPKKRASAFDAAAASKSRVQAAPAKVNTLEKSRLDWAGFVDKEGIGDDLKKWNKGDKGYLDRQAFLGRVDDNRDKQWKEGKRK